MRENYMQLYPLAVKGCEKLRGLRKVKKEVATNRKPFEEKSFEEMRVEEYEEPARDMSASEALTSHLKFGSLEKNQDLSVYALVGVTANQVSERPNGGAFSSISNRVVASGEDLERN
jgi:hypothetical protein